MARRVLPQPPEPTRLTRGSSLNSRFTAFHLVVATDEAGPLHRQVVDPGVQGAKRRELAGQVGVVQLEDALGTGQVLEPVHPQIAQAGALRQSLDRQVGRRLGQHRLAPMRHRHKPGRPVHRRTEIVAVALLHLAGMQAHPHPQDAPLRPTLTAQPSCASSAAPKPVASTVKGGREPIPDRGEHPATMGLDARPHDLVMAGQRARIASGADSHNRVEPSTSVNRKVTVPEGTPTPGVSHERHTATVPASAQSPIRASPDEDRVRRERR